MPVPKFPTIAVAGLCAACSASMQACSSPGHVEGPMGEFELRSALYRVSSGALSNVFVLLSNGELACGMPQMEDPITEALLLEELNIAACREGAQHVALTLYDFEDPPVAGEYPGLTLANEESVSADLPRAANAFYYGIVEAYLSTYVDLARTYRAEEDVYLDLGDGGQVHVATDAGRLSGWFEFPDRSGSTVAGEFEAEECTGDTMLLDLVHALGPSEYCTTPIPTTDEQ